MVQEIVCAALPRTAHRAGPAAQALERRAQGLSSDYLVVRGQWSCFLQGAAELLCHDEAAG